MSEELQRCSVRGCENAAALVIKDKLFCVEHALESERALPPRNGSKLGEKRETIAKPLDPDEADERSYDLIEKLRRDFPNASPAELLRRALPD